MKYSDVNWTELDFSTLVEIRKGLSILDPSTMVGMTMLIGNDTPFRQFYLTFLLSISTSKWSKEQRKEKVVKAPF